MAAREAQQLSAAITTADEAGPKQSRASSTFDVDVAALRELTAKYGQSHVWTHWEKLTDVEKQILVQDIKHLDLAELTRTFETVDKQNTDSSPGAAAPTITPFPNVTSLTSENASRWYKHGLDLLSSGKVAVLLMAGGQGTRLGSAEPKGCYDIGLPSHKSLFQIQAERLVRLHQLAARHVHVHASTSPSPSSISIPWYIMTSIITDTPTRLFFAKHNYFGINPKDVIFFQQAELPALTNDGKIIMEKTYKLSLAPNGNGGIFDALKKSGSLADMKKRGIEYIHVYGVDNVLVKIGDPTLLGFHVSTGTPISNKVVLKTDPRERVGVMCYRNGRPSVVEYSEIPESVSASRDSSGALLYSAGNIAQHVFTLSFLDELEKSPLQYHVARKAIPYIDTDGTLVTPNQPNGIKLELFVFDIFQMTNSCACLAVPRESEFSPVKNAVALGVLDTPETARIHLSNYHASLVRAAGGMIQGEIDSTHAFEISGLITYQGEGLEQHVRGKTFTLPYQLH